ncbi:hypothetical protein [Mesomycoplasma neurolyticum]|uniref:Uncharacterized protein n=1 Tax=Mesomycoplasma neurolyticum TaxID=2120 RepID=A0A449A5G1_9BACT|nr:hypothetical protein [Mesomycoplasma neurolyticum]VEU59501.1 Uncharacterised protein [Mesomycoplasma neurolyticum]
MQFIFSIAFQFVNTKKVLLIQVILTKLDLFILDKQRINLNVTKRFEQLNFLK